jgi:hypothetical protein
VRKCDRNKWNCKLNLERKAETFLKETDNIAYPLFPDPNNGAAFVPESETSLAGSGEWFSFLLVGLKMADKKGGKLSHSSRSRLKMYLMYFWCTSKVCSSPSLYHPFIFTPNTGAVPELIQVYQSIRPPLTNDQGGLLL